MIRCLQLWRQQKYKKTNPCSSRESFNAQDFKNKDKEEKKFNQPS